MGGLAVESGDQDAKKEVQVNGTSAKEDDKDQAESRKPGPSRILRYAEVWVQYIRPEGQMPIS